jgi:hypothetical protein
MDRNVAKSGGELECYATDAGGPFGPGPRRGLLAGWQDASVGVR